MVAGVPGGVWVRTLASRLSITWRSLSAIAEHPNIAGDHEVERMLVVDEASPVDRLSHHLDQVDRGPLEWAAVVEAGQQQQVVDEHAHADGLLLDVPHDPGQVFGAVIGTPAKQLGVAPDGGERRAQLVGGVGDEPAQAVLGRVALTEGRLDLAEHGVEGDPEAAHLGTRIGLGHPTGQVARGDVLGGLLDVVEGAQAEAHHPEAGGRRRHQHGAGHRQLDPAQIVKGGGHVAHRQGDDELCRRSGGSRSAAARGVRCRPIRPCAGSRFPPDRPPPRFPISSLQERRWWRSVAAGLGAVAGRPLPRRPS